VKICGQKKNSATGQYIERIPAMKKYSILCWSLLLILVASGVNGDDLATIRSFLNNKTDDAKVQHDVYRACLALSWTGTEEAVPVLKQLLDHLGLNLERNLAEGKPEAAKTSLKAALAEIIQQSTQAEAGKGAAQAKSMLSAIEMFQLAQAQLATGKEQIYPLPLPFLDTGYLLVEEDGGHRQSGDEDAVLAKFSLFLSLTDLGFLRIDFVKSQEGLALRLRADNQEKADFIASFADDLRTSIDDTAVVSLSFAGDAQDPIKELLHKVLPDNSGLLSATA
jgi:hypothetical protein